MELSETYKMIEGLIKDEETFDHNNFLIDNLERIMTKNLTPYKKFHEGIEQEK